MANLMELQKIKIPIIQRDYVQGRDDDRAKEVLENFLETIFTSLAQKDSLHLDFIYGYYENGWFIPIDGQQRLTLLFLLYWYFAKKEQQPLSIELSYETRVAAREFCKRLMDFDIDFSQNSISEQIKNNKNFLPFWTNDPTVSSMLRVLDEIHQKDKKDIAFEDLTKITFEIFDMPDFDSLQAEELYRKMNARGKVLSSFENFKAIIQKIIFHKYSEQYYKEIAQKFEGKWIDSFWKSYEDCKVIDELFMRFIYFITEMRAYTLKQKGNVKSPLFWEQFYSNRENLQFLQDRLDRVEQFKEKAQWIEKKLSFFEPKKQETLFDEIIQNYEDMSIANKLLAYLLLEVVIKNWDNEAILQLMRIARNYVHRIRALRNGRIDYEINMAYKDMKKYLDAFSPFLQDNSSPLFPTTLKPYEILYEHRWSDKSMQQEQEKAKLIQDYNLQNEIWSLEDHPYLQGDFSLLLACNFIEDKSERIRWMYKHFNKLFVTDHLLCRSLLAVDDYALWIGAGWKGAKYFFGEKGKWEIFFTLNERNKGDIAIYNQFFSLLSNQYKDITIRQAMQSIINQKLGEYKQKKKDWIYYFLKYPIILTPFKKYRNIIGWLNGVDDGDIEKLESSKRVTNRRVNVYLLALLDILGVEDVEEMVGIDEDDGMSFIDWPKRHMQIWVEGEHIVVYNKKREYPPIRLFAKEDAILQAKRIIDDL